MKTTPTPWPLTVPVLTGRDIYRGDFTSRDGCRHDLYGWTEEVFPNPTVRGIVQGAIRNIIPAQYDGAVIPFNDDPSVPKSKVAAVWNRAMREMGYTERV